MDRQVLRRITLCLSVLARVLNVLLHIPPPPQYIDSPSDHLHRIMIMMQALQQFILLMFSLVPPPLVSASTLRDRLFFDFHGHHFYGRDVFTQISQQRYLFWLNTIETPETFMDIVFQTAPRFLIITRSGNLRQRAKRFKLSIVNRVLVVFIWLRKYPHIDTLALMFDVSP